MSVRTTRVRVRVRVFGIAALCGVGVSAPASAQDIDVAIKAYNADHYVEAAFHFFDVMQNSDDADARVKAEYYLAHSLYKANYWLPAYYYYGQVFNAGDAHPYFLKATEGLLAVGLNLDDDLLIPEVINKGYSPAFQHLKATELNAINYMIGMVSHRKGDYGEAKQFLEAVTESSPYYLKARYLLAILGVKTATEKGSDDYAAAIKYFNEMEDKLRDAKTGDDKKLARLALLGKARAFYSQGDFQKSVQAYESIPRFSEDWYDAMFESGWSYFQNAQFGKALGMVHSIQSPYFDDRYRAESFVLKATTYFQLCHFDRARKSLESFFKIYEPMADTLKPWLEGERSDEDLVKLIVDGDPKFSNEIRLQIANNRRFQKFLAHVREAETEIGKAKKEFPEGTFKAQLVALLEDEEKARLALTGNLVRQQMNREAVFLDDFLNQGRIIKFETADAERKMLEAGKDITKGPRAQGPRPIVPSASFQYWAFLGEYWIDELGYYQHSIKDECLPEVFQ